MTAVKVTAAVAALFAVFVAVNAFVVPCLTDAWFALLSW